MKWPILKLSLHAALIMFCVNVIAQGDNYYKAEYAVRTNNIDIVKKLFPGLTDKQKGKLLFTASYKKKLAAVKFILDQGVDPNAINDNGENVLTALSRQHDSDPEIAKYLIERGAEVNYRNSKRTGAGCMTPLKAAVRSNNKELVKLFIKHGVKIDRRACIRDTTALEEAAEFSHMDIMEILLANGADPTFEPGAKRSFNALDRLLYDKHPVKYNESQLTRVVSVLLERGAGVGPPALFGAARRGHAEVLDLLLKQNKNTVDLNKLYWITKANGHQAATAVLKKYGADYVSKYHGKKTISDKESVDFALELRIRWRSSDKLTQQRIRELHDLVKRNLRAQPGRPVLWYLDSQINCKYAAWRAKEISPNTSIQARNKIKHDATLNRYKKQCNDSLKKALSSDKKAKRRQRLTRSMLISAGYFGYANPDLRVIALKRAMDGRRNKYEEGQLRSTFSGFEDEANYLYRKKTHYPYSAMISAYVEHSQYQNAIKLINEQIKMFPGKRSGLEDRRWQMIHRYRSDPVVEKFQNGISLVSGKVEPITNAFFDEIRMLKLVSETELKIVRKKGINAKINNKNETLVNNLAAHLTTKLEDPRLVYIVMLINTGANLEIEDINGRRPLHNAAMRRNLLASSVLLEKDKDINKKDKDGKTPLLLALTTFGNSNDVETDLKLLKFLLHKGADPNLADNSGLVPVMKCYFPATEKYLQLLLESGADINKRDLKGNTVFMRWVTDPRYGSKTALEVAEYLVQHGADLNSGNNEGVTPLMMAAQNNRLELVKYLLARGVDPEIKDNEGHTALERIKLIPEKQLAHYEKKLKRMGDARKSMLMNRIDQMNKAREPMVKLLENAGK